LQSSSLCGRSFGIRSSRLPAHLAERICRWRSSADVGVHVDDRHDFAEGQFYGILHLTSVASICRTVGLKDGQEGPAKGAQAQQRWRSSLGQQKFKQRCRCARSHAPLAARAPFPLQSVAFITPPSTEAHSNRPLQLVPLLQTTRWRLTRATPQYACQPHQPHQPGSYRRSSPPSRFYAPMRTARTARTHNFQPTALWGRLPRRLRPHRSRRPRSCLRRRSGCCPPTAAPFPRMRTL
jgi:hypothetical protein